VNITRRKNSDQKIIAGRKSDAKLPDRTGKKYLKGPIITFIDIRKDIRGARIPVFLKGSFMRVGKLSDLIHLTSLIVNVMVRAK
jgi:hypothetical protein